MRNLSKKTPQFLLEPSWICPLQPSIDIDLYRGRAWNGHSVVPIQSLLTCGRAASGWEDNLGSDPWFLFGANQTRRTNFGLLSEEARTCENLWSRDLTNAAWVASNMTTAKNFAGLDRIANSCTTLTAGAANATLLQSITLASTTLEFAAFVSRVTGNPDTNPC